MAALIDVKPKIPVSEKRRVRTVTEKERVRYTDKVNKLSDIVNGRWRELEDVFETVDLDLDSLGRMNNFYEVLGIPTTLPFAYTAGTCN